MLPHLSCRQHAEWRFPQQLKISLLDVEDILVTLILDGKVQGKVDQVNGRLELDTRSVHTLTILSKAVFDTLQTSADPLLTLVATRPSRIGRHSSPSSRTP